MDLETRVCIWVKTSCFEIGPWICEDYCKLNFLRFYVNNIIYNAFLESIDNREITYKCILKNNNFVQINYYSGIETFFSDDLICK